METVLITGASSGIGYELAKIYAKNNYNLVLVARRKENLEKLKNEILENINKNIEIYIFDKDLSIENISKELYEEIKNKKIKIDILINNAGFGIYKQFINYNKEDMRKNKNMINVNINSLVELTKLFLDEMIENKKVKILNVASIAAFQPGPLMASYYASKSFVLSFTEAIREEVVYKMKNEGMKRKDILNNIKISVLCPGPTSTEFEKSANLENSSLFEKMKVMSAKKVAKIAFEKFEKGKEIIITGLINKIIVFGIRFLPRKWVVKIARKLQESKK